jgi:hypothetical protein
MIRTKMTSVGRQAVTEDVIKNLFNDTRSVAIAKQFFSPERFDELASHYIATLKEQATHHKTGYNANTFSKLLEKKAPELEAALSHKPNVLQEIKDYVKLGSIIPEHIIANPSRTHSTGWIMEQLHKYSMLAQHPERIPGALLSKITGKLDESKITEEFKRNMLTGMPDSLLTSAQRGAKEEMLRNKQVQYGVLQKIEQMGQKATQLIDRNAKQIFESEKAVTRVGAMKAASDPEQTLKDFNKHAEQLNKITSTPHGLVETLAKAALPIQQHAPKIAASLQKTAGVAAQFLKSKLPGQDPASPMMPPHQPSKQEIATYNRYKEIVDNPAKALELVKSGNLTHEHMEALEAVYPKQLAQMRQAVMEHLPDKGADLPYSKKLVLTMFLGTDLHNSLKPDQITANQMAMHIAAEPPKGGINPTSTGMGKINKSEQIQTDIQKIEIG